MFGQLVRDARSRRGWTQQSLAERAGISVRTLREVEQGRSRRLTPASSTRLATVLELSVTDLDTAPTLWIGVLGPLIVRVGRAAIDVGPNKQRTLLGLLALRPDEVVGRDEIVDVLWGARPPASWRSLVQTYVAGLRKSMEPHSERDVIRTSRAGYQLTIPEEQLDLLSFSRHGTDRASLAAALALWRGPVLADLPDRLTQHPAAQALHRRRVAAALDFADAATADGGHEEAIAVLEPIVTLEPLHEGLHARLVLALAASGRQVDAIELFHRVRDRLDKDLALYPGPELAAALDQVLRSQRDGAATPTESAPAAPAQLPADVTGFAGRDRYLERLDAVGADGQRSTAIVISAIAGTGGVGKTALAVHWAHQVKGRFPDGQLYVNLRGYDPDQPVDPADALAGFLRALGVPDTQQPHDTAERAARFRSMMDGRRMLVLLDNARSAEQVRPLLPAAPTAQVVVTSRDALRGLVAREGAVRLELDLLPLDECRVLLRDLIGERVDAEPAATDSLIAQCAQLPLALRLVADLATSRPTTALAELVPELTDEQHRLEVLNAGGDSHTAVESVFHWSYRTLPVDAARLFRLLGLAPGADVDVYAAAALLAVSTAEAGRLLGELVRGHLLEEHSQRRFRFHDLLRIFAKRRAEAVDTQDERQRAIRRLVDYYLHTAYTAERLTDPLHDPVAIPLRAPEPGVSTKVFTTTTEALEWHAAESANLLAMVAYVDAHGWHEHAVQFARAMRTGCYIQARWRDYLTVYEVALRAANSIHHEPAQAICHASLAQVSAILSRFEVALDHAAQALRISGRLGDVSGQAFAHRAIAWIHGRSGAHADAIDHCLRGLDLYREVGNREGESDLLNGLGWSYAQLGRYEEALPVCEQAIEVARDIGQPRSEAPALDSLGYVNRSLGDYPRAMENYRLAIEKYTDLGMHHDVAGATNGLGDTYAATGDLPSALAAWRRAIDLLDDPDGPLTRAIHAKIAAGQPEA